MYRKFIKSLIDKLIALVLLALVLPFSILIHLTLILTQGRVVLFTQIRSGKNKKPFRIFKIRTLKPIDSGYLGMENRQYTFLGMALRRSGLDELPQLVNVLKGEMSFIGPRPMPVEYELKYSQNQLKRFEVKPGITGWAQVHGKNDISWGRRFELDAWYVDHISLGMDIKIGMMTLAQFLGTVFIRTKKRVEMPVFNGSNLT